MNEQQNRPVVLIVDDTAENITLISSLLGDHYKSKVAVSGAKALQIAINDPPDLILLDIMMPGMDGYAVCEALKKNPATREVPVIFLTAKAQVEDEAKGFELGAVDYITKPVSPPLLIARINTHISLQQARKSLTTQNEQLEALVERRTRQMNGLQESLIKAMAAMAETRDNETGQHILRTQLYIYALANRLKTNPRFSDFLTEPMITTLYKSAPLHDIGKVGVPDRILLKPGKLTPEEFEEMKKHTTYGRDTIASVSRELDTPEPFLEVAQDIAYYHHEKWDGSGYPTGIAGDAIPIPARLMALADVFDALISKRVYKEAMPMSEAKSIIVAGKGQHFDPDVVDAFVDIFNEFESIANHNHDANDTAQDNQAQNHEQKKTPAAAAPDTLGTPVRAPGAKRDSTVPEPAGSV